jgi:flagellar biosynthetic protein FliQ
MSADQLVDLWRTALAVIVEVSAPFLLSCLAVGLIVAIIQTATQLQESVLTFVPKLAAALVVLALAGHWCLDRLGKFTSASFSAHADRVETRAAP